MNTPSGGEGERVAKRIARAGLCSRREAEDWIRAGRVSVDGRTLETPAVLVTAASDIRVDGRRLPDAEPARLWRYHKPPGLIVSRVDPQGRTTVFEKLPAEMPRVIAVGRLDLPSEGLLLLTNDGGLARDLERPAEAGGLGWRRRYRVRVHGTPDPARLAALADGITVDGIRYGAIEAAVERQQGSNCWVVMSLREGRNREIRKVCDHLGWPVTRLIRTSFGPFQLGGLARGNVEEVPARVLRDQMRGGQKPTRPKRPRETAPKRPSGRRR